MKNKPNIWTVILLISSVTILLASFFTLVLFSEYIKNSYDKKEEIFKETISALEYKLLNCRLNTINEIFGEKENAAKE